MTVPPTDQTGSISDSDGRRTVGEQAALSVPPEALEALGVQLHGLATLYGWGAPSRYIGITTDAAASLEEAALSEPPLAVVEPGDLPTCQDLASPAVAVWLDKFDGDPARHLLGSHAPDWAGAVAVLYEAWAKLPDDVDVPDVEPEPDGCYLMRVFRAVSRTGAQVEVVHVRGGGTWTKRTTAREALAVSTGQDDGKHWIGWALRRSLRLPTPPPTKHVARMVLNFWATTIAKLGPQGLGDPEATAREALRSRPDLYFLALAASMMRLATKLTGSELQCLGYGDFDLACIPEELVDHAEILEALTLLAEHDPRWIGSTSSTADIASRVHAALPERSDPLHQLTFTASPVELESIDLGAAQLLASSALWPLVHSYLSHMLAVTVHGPASLPSLEWMGEGWLLTEAAEVASPTALDRLARDKRWPDWFRASCRRLAKATWNLEVDLSTAA